LATAVPPYRAVPRWCRPHRSRFSMGTTDRRASHLTAMQVVFQELGLAARTSTIIFSNFAIKRLTSLGENTPSGCQLCASRDGYRKSDHRSKLDALYSSLLKKLIRVWARLRSPRSSTSFRKLIRSEPVSGLLEAKPLTERRSLPQNDPFSKAPALLHRCACEETGE
jgi:hypothetical protein